MMETIINVDNDKIRRLSVNILLRENFPGYQIYEVNSFQEAMAEYGGQHPVVVVLGGFVLTNFTVRDLIAFMKKSPATRFVVYSKLSKDDNLNKYLDLGILGLMATPEVPNELVRCISAVLKNKKYLSESLMEYLISSVPAVNKEAGSPLVVLSRRELQVARYLCNGLKLIRIANYLDLTLSNISRVKRNIFHKLNVTNMDELSKKMNTHYPHFCAATDRKSQLR